MKPGGVHCRAMLVDSVMSRSVVTTEPARSVEARLLGGYGPSARLEVIPGAGHMPFWEAPERFFALVDAFLSEPLPRPTPS